LPPPFLRKKPLCCGLPAPAPRKSLVCCLWKKNTPSFSSFNHPPFRALCTNWPFAVRGIVFFSRFTGNFKGQPLVTPPVFPSPFICFFALQSPSGNSVFGFHSGFSLQIFLFLYRGFLYGGFFWVTGGSDQYYLFSTQLLPFPKKTNFGPFWKVFEELLLVGNPKLQGVFSLFF